MGSEEDQKDDGYKDILAMLNFMIGYDQAGGGQEKCLASKASRVMCSSNECNDVDNPFGKDKQGLALYSFH
jgi:hypothetical protein